MANTEKIKELVNELNIGTNKEKVGDFLISLLNRIVALEGAVEEIESPPAPEIPETIVTGASFTEGTSTLTLTTNGDPIEIDLSSLANEA